MPKIHTIKRKKFALYFGNFIKQEEVWLVFKVINEFKNLTEATAWIEKYFKKINEENPEIPHRNLTDLNKRAVLAIQIFFEYNYYPIFPEMFDYFKNTIYKRNMETMEFMRGKDGQYTLEYILPIDKIFEKEFLQHFHFKFPQYLFKYSVKRNVVALEKFLSEIADVIFNFMETNSSSVEMGLYLTRETFPKTIVITPSKNTVEKTSIGEFSQRLIIELGSEKHPLSKYSKYSRISWSMCIKKVDNSKNSSEFFTYIWPYELNDLIKKRMIQLDGVIHTKKNSIYSKKHKGFWSIYLHSIKDKHNFLKDIKTKQLSDKGISGIEEMLVDLFGQEHISDISLKFGELINQKIFSNTALIPMTRQVGLFILFSYLFEAMFGVRFLKELKETSLFFYTKKGRKIFIQPDEYKTQDTISKEMLQELFKNEFSKSSIAYQKNKSIFNAVAPHKNSKYFLKLDIKDFFGTIDLGMLERRLLKYKIPSLKVSEIIDKVNNGEKGIKQGMILSPILSNIFLCSFDKSIENEFGNHVIYTRYSDDMLFSFPAKSTSEKIKAFVKVELEKIGMTINEKKTTIQNHNINFLGLTVGSGKIKLSRRKSKKIDFLKEIKSKGIHLTERQKGVFSYYVFITKLIKEGENE